MKHSGANLEPRWSEITAIFGGTFDPPHLGHLEAVRGLLKNPGVKRVLVIPAAKPPHKPTHADSQHRLKMTEHLFDGVPEVKIDQRELSRESSGVPSYSFDTISEISREMDAGNEKLTFVIGSDQLRDLPAWHRFPELLGLCHWIVLTRRPDGHATAMEAIRALESRGLVRLIGSDLWSLPQRKTLKIMNTEARALSSTEIRRQIALNGRPPTQALSESVTRYLMDHRLYGISGATDSPTNGQPYE